MKKCKKCNIKYNIYSRYCPLCNSKLEGNSLNLVFPSNVKKDNTNIIITIILGSTLLLSLLSILIEYLISNKVLYSIYIMILLGINYIFIYFIIKNKYNVVSIIYRYGIFLIILLYFLYIMLEKNIINNIFIPILCIVLVIFQLVVYIVKKVKDRVNYFSILLYLVILLLIQIVLFVFKYITFKVLIYISISLNIFVLLGILLIDFKNIINDIKGILNF